MTSNGADSGGGLALSSQFLALHASQMVEEAAASDLLKPSMSQLSSCVGSEVGSAGGRVGEELKAGRAGGPA